MRPTKAETPPLLPAEIVAVVAASGAMIASFFIRSDKKHLLMDELFTLSKAVDPSFRHMVEAVSWTEGTTPLYFSVTWLVTRLLGASETALRAPSAAGMVIALIVTWSSLRRSHGRVAALLGAAPVFLGSNLVARMGAEARCYGVLTAFTALALADVHRMARSRVIPRGLFVRAGVWQCLMVLSHPFGGLTGVSMVAALVLLDRARGWWRPRVWAGLAAGWLPYAGWIPTIMRRRAHGELPQWQLAPNLEEVIATFGLGVQSVLPLVAAMLAVATVVSRRADPPPAADEDGTGRREMLWLGVAVVVGPVALACLISYALKPTFADRYLIGGVIGWSVVLGHLARVCWPRHAGSRGPLRWALVVVLLFDALQVGRAVGREPDPPVEIASANPLGIPIVVEAPAEFMIYDHYEPAQSIWCVVDEEASRDPLAWTHARSDDKLMRRLAKLYPRFKVIEGDELLAEFDQFVLKDVPYVRWFENAVDGNEDLTVIGIAAGLYYVKRRR